MMYDCLEPEDRLALAMMQENGYADERPIGCMVFQWHELPFGKIETERFNVLLNKHIDLSKYGTGIQNFVIGFIAYPKRMEYNANQKNTHDYFKEEKVMELAVMLDYEYLETASKKAAFEHLKHKTLLIAQSILPTFDFPDFDTKRFLEDLETVLEKED